jgi:hypothetical protein
MSVSETLKRAMNLKQCVRVMAEGRARDICPHALGFKNGRPRLLAFQYQGGSASGLAAGGQWRAFFVGDIATATIIDGPWHTGPNFVAKAEACLDRIEFRVAH